MRYLLKYRTKPLSLHYRSILCVVIPALMLVLLLTSISVSAFHNHRDCENPDNCAICTFQVSSSVLSFDKAPSADPYDEPVLLSFVTLPERIAAPFHTTVFPSHAPPQFS
jgi:hypothetical protein